MSQNPQGLAPLAAPPPRRLRRSRRRWIGPLAFALAMITPLEGAVAQQVSSPVETPNAVLWLLPDFPPVNILRGPRQGTGYADVFLHYFMDRAPELAHRSEPSSMSRVFGLMQQGQLVCHPSLLETPERDAFVDFSGPVEFVLTLNIVVRRDRAARLAPYRNGAGAIEMGRLLADTSLVTTLQEKRGYPPVISDAVAAIGTQKNIIWTSVDDDGPFRQLAAGWIDYIIAYPDEVKWYSDQLQQSETPTFDYIPVAGLQEYVVGHVGCTKGPWGQKIVERVNQVVAQAGPRPPWIDAEAHLLDAAGAKRFEDVFARNSPFHP